MEWKNKLAQLGFRVLHDDKPQLYLRQADVEKFIEQNFETQKLVNVDQRVMLKAVEDEEREYNELFNELNKNFTAYNWFITTNPNSDEAKKRWGKIREIINRFSA